MIFALFFVTSLFGLDIIDKTNIQRYIALSKKEISALPQTQQAVYKNKVQPNIFKNIKKLKFTFVPGSEQSRPIYFTITDAIHNNTQIRPKVGILIASLKNNNWSIDSFTPLHTPHITCEDKRCSLWDKNIEVISSNKNLPPVILIRYRTASKGALPLFVHYVLQWSSASHMFELSDPIVTNIPFKTDHEAARANTPAPELLEEGDALLSALHMREPTDKESQIQNTLDLDYLL